MARAPNGDPPPVGRRANVSPRQRDCNSAAPWHGASGVGAARRSRSLGRRSAAEHVRRCSVPDQSDQGGMTGQGGSQGGSTEGDWANEEQSTGSTGSSGGGTSTDRMGGGSGLG